MPQQFPQSGQPSDQQSRHYVQLEEKKSRAFVRSFYSFDTTYLKLIIIYTIFNTFLPSDFPPAALFSNARTPSVVKGNTSSMASDTLPSSNHWAI